MKKQKQIINLMAAVCFCSLINEAPAQPVPLSCNMQMLLVGLTGLQRDQGYARNETAVAKNKDSELTKKEIKFILDRVYIAGKNQTHDQIKDDVYRKCQSGR